MRIGRCLVVGVFVLFAGMAYGQKRIETFDDGLGALGAVMTDPTGNNGIHFSASSNAGAAAGELCGDFARTASADAAYVADTHLGGVLTTARDLEVSGQFTITEDNGWDGSVIVGFIHTHTMDFLGLEIREPGVPEGHFRVSGRVEGGGGVEVTNRVDAPLGGVVEFSLRWNSNPDGTGRLNGTIHGEEVKLDVDAVTGPIAFNAFAVGSALADTSTPENRTTVCFDNLSYSVVSEQSPVPVTTTVGGAVLVALLLGAGVLVLRRREPRACAD